MTRTVAQFGRGPIDLETERQSYQNTAARRMCRIPIHSHTAIPILWCAYVTWRLELTHALSAANSAVRISPPHFQMLVGTLQCPYTTAPSSKECYYRHGFANMYRYLSQPPNKKKLASSGQVLIKVGSHHHLCYLYSLAVLMQSPVGVAVGRGLPFPNF